MTTTTGGPVDSSKYRGKYIRGKYQGVAQIINFNRHWYIIAASAMSVTAAALLFMPLSAPFFYLFLLAAASALYWLIASLVAAHWIYDRSGIYSFEWLQKLFPKSPRSWMNIHAGFDEVSPVLRSLFPTESYIILDIHDPELMTEPSIERARSTVGAQLKATAAKTNDLPVEDGSVEAAFVIFAAHEIRDNYSRDEFFCELKRALTPDGKVVLVEHLRDIPNFIAFGPGFMHFLPEREWRRVAGASGLSVTGSFRITPFVGVFTLERT